MATKLDLINGALLRCGAEPLTEPLLTANVVKRAYLINNQYDITLAETLADSGWNFAIKRASLTKLATVPLYEFACEYTLPTDCLRVLSVEPEGTRFKVEDGKILTDSVATTMFIKYIYKNITTTTYAPLFNKVFILKLAEDISFGLVQSQALQEKITKEAERYIRRARSYNSQEGTAESRYDSSYTMGIRQ